MAMFTFSAGNLLLTRSAAFSAASVPLQQNAAQLSSVGPSDVFLQAGPRPSPALSPATRSRSLGTGSVEGSLPPSSTLGRLRLPGALLLSASLVLGGCTLDRQGQFEGPIPADGGGGIGGGMGGTAGEGGVGGSAGMGGAGGGPMLPVPTLQRPTAGLTLAPTRAFLLWQVDPMDAGAVMAYESCYTTMGLGAIDEATECPNSNVSDQRFRVLDPLTATSTYHWKVRSCSDLAGMNCSADSEIRSFGTDNSLIGWWRMDEGTGTMLADSAGTNNGTFQGSPTWIPGISGSALQFNGMDSVMIGDSPSLEDMDQLSVLAWINTTSTAMNRPIFAKWFSGTSSYILRVSSFTSGAVGFATQSPVTVNSESTTLVNDGTWHLATGTYDGVNQRIYVDSILEDTDPQSGTISNSEEELCLGDFCDVGMGQGQGIIGAIDDAVITARAMSDEEILIQFCAVRAPFNIAMAMSIPALCE